MTFLAQLKQPTSRFKQTIVRSLGNRTLVNTAAWMAIDATNLPWAFLDLAVGDVVECKLLGSMWNSTSGAYGGVDFAVDRPTSADTRVNVDNDFGAGEIQSNLRLPVSITARFVATEAGSHGFRPVWRCYNAASTMTMANAVSGDDDVAIVFSVENLGPTLS